MDPIDLRRFHLSDAIAIPGLHSFARPWSGADPNTITIGSDNGSEDFVALASKVKALFDAIKTHEHTAFNSPSSSLSALNTNVGSATVKVKG